MTGARRTEELAPGPATSLSPPFFARRLMLEAAPKGPADPAGGTVLVLHAGALKDALLESLPNAEIVELPLEAGESEIQSALRATPQEACTLVDLRPLSAGLQADGAFDAARTALRAVFRLARALQRDGLRYRRIALATALGGGHGLDGHSTPTSAQSAASGAAAGAWKAVVREWLAADDAPAELSLRVIDLPCDPDADDWVGFAREVARSGPLEMGVVGGEARTPVLREVTLDGNDPSLSSDSVALLIGGARGIVARISLELAERFGCRLVLMGRTAPGVATETPLDRTSARRMARVELGETAEVGSINRRADELLRGQEVVATLEALHSAGAAEAVYVQGDASQPEAIGEALKATRQRFGRLDLIVQGAGVDRSRSLSSKTEAELDLVLGAKVGGAAALFEAAKEVRLVAIGSVSGRWGNARQIDYAGANESLAKLTLAAGGLVLDYSAWSEVGMAAGLAGAMRDRGVDPLDPARAAAATVDLIAGGATGEWVLAGRLAEASRPRRQYDVVFDVPGAETVLRRTLHLDDLTYLRDHRATRAGLLPGVVALEAMTDAALALEPALGVRGLREVRFERPIKVFPDKPVDIEVAACRESVSRHDGGALACSARISVGGSTHHRSVILLGERLTPRAARPQPRDWVVGPTREEVYRTFFHGPSLQVVETTELANECLQARSPKLEAPLGADIPAAVRARALARELAFQAAAILLMATERQVALPVGMAAVDTYGVAELGEQIVAVARRRAHGADGLFHFDVEIQGGDGRVLECFEDLTFRYLARL